MDNLDRARASAEAARGIIESSGTIARFSWLSANSAYRTGKVALLQTDVGPAMYVIQFCCTRTMY